MVKIQDDKEALKFDTKAKQSQEKKIVINTNIPVPYRVAFFSRLSHQPGIDLTVFFEGKTTKNRRWELEFDGLFKYKYLPNLRLTFQKWSDYSFGFVPTLLPELLTIKPDAIVIPSWVLFSSHLSFLVSKLWGIPLILWSGSTAYEPSPGRTLINPIVKFIVKHTDAYVVYGTRAKEYLISLGAKEEAIFFMYNTVDVDFFYKQSSALSYQERQAIKRQHEFKAEKLVLSVGQLIERKGLYHLLDAFARLKQADNALGLVIAGYGPLEEKLRQYCSQHNIQDVYFSGYIDPAHLPEIYAVADLFVLPSTEEVWGLVLNEAMACGLPVISTNVAGASVDLIQNGVNGYIVEAGNTVQLYEAMENIMTDSERRQAMGEKSREIILSRFTLDHAVQGMIQAVEYVCARKKGSAY